MLCATAGLCACSTSGSLLGGQSSWGLPLKSSHAAGLLQEPWSAWSHRRCRGHSLSELWQGTSQSRGQGHTEWCLEEPALFSCSAGPGEGLVLVKILPQVPSSAAAGAPGALLGDHSMLRDQQHSVSSWCLPCIPSPQHCLVMSLPSIIHAFISIPYWLALPPGALFSSSGPQHVGMSSRKAHCASPMQFMRAVFLPRKPGQVCQRALRASATDVPAHSLGPGALLEML